MSDPGLFSLLRAGDRGALARAITLVESTREEDRSAINELLTACLPFAGGGLRIGITGIPGVGKSSLIDALGIPLIAAGHRVAVLAIDPSSARSGGSILGDKTRMERLALHPSAFVRPSASAGNLGGVARRTREAMLLCEAAGYDRVIIETVGIGQSELEVDHLVDQTVLLTIGGAGDELQGIKRGIMEAADLIAITKTDGDAKTRNERTRTDLRNAISLLPPRPNGTRPEVLLCSAITGEGIPDLIRAIEEKAAREQANGQAAERRKEQDLHWLDTVVDEGARARFLALSGVAEAIAEARRAVAEGRATPFQAATALLDRF